MVNTRLIMHFGLEAPLVPATVKLVGLITLFAHLGTIHLIWNFIGKLYLCAIS